MEVRVTDTVLAQLSALKTAHVADLKQRWRELFDSESVNQSYACRILRLTLLAPNIVTEILDEQHSSNLMLKRVMRRLPIRWDEQTAILKAASSPHEPCRVRDR